MSPQRIPGAVAIFLLVQVLINLLFPVIIRFDRPYDWDSNGYMWLGIIFSQVSLLALWNALWQGKKVHRTALSLFAMLLLWSFAFVLILCTQVGTEPWPFGLTMLAQWLVIQAPLWWLRVRFGWRIKHFKEPSGIEPSSSVQFGIRHLLIWTTLIALLLGVGKLVRGAFEARDMIGFGLLLAFHTLFTWPTLIAAVASRRTVLALFASFLFTLGVTIAELPIFERVMHSDLESIFLWLNFSQFFWLAGSTLALRMIGFRLVREPKGKIDGV